MVIAYDPRKDPTASSHEKMMYDFFERSIIRGNYRDAWTILKGSRNIPKYIIDKFEPVVEFKMKEINERDDERRAMEEAEGGISSLI